jgi:hypothetical protein
MSAKPKAKPKTAKSSPALFRKLALALPEVTESPHFDATSFRLRGKIFATYRESDGRAVVRLAVDLQDAMLALHPKIFTRLGPGWTRMTLELMPRDLLESIVASAWSSVASKKVLQELAPKVRKA